MRNDISKVRGLLVLVAGALLLGLAVACTSDETAGEDGLSGSIEIDGSSTVGPISEAVAEEFSKVHPRCTPTSPYPVRAEGSSGSR